MDDIRRRLDIWGCAAYPEEDYPPGSEQGEVGGVDLALLDGEVAALAYRWLEGRWMEGDDKTLELCLEDLGLAMPQLSPAGRLYFEPAMEILLDIRHARSKPRP